MSKLIEEIKHTVDATIPEKEDLPKMAHPKADYIIFILRNIFVALAVIIFVFSMFFRYDLIKGIAYVLGAVAYFFECMALTDCFTTKVEHHEMFMVYCFGPLYLLMAADYIISHLS